MNGRLYDPRVGRFLSPDPIVSEPWSGQGWNPYSYVGNSPLSRTDPTGYCYNPRYPCPMHANQGGGFASGTATLLSRSLSWRVPIVLAVHWGPVSFGIGWGGFLNGGDDGGGYFGSFFGGFYRPYVSVGFGAPYPVVTSTARTVALGQEPVPADGPMALEPIVDIAADVGEWVFDFLIWDTVETGMQTYEDFRVGNYGDAAFGVVLTACDVVKACKIGGKILKRVPGVERFGGWIRGKLSRTRVGNGGTVTPSRPPLRRMHGEETLTSGSDRYRYEDIHKMPTEEIVESLRRGAKEPLRVRPDELIYDGNTRVFVLEQRGFDIDSLPREIYDPP